MQLVSITSWWQHFCVFLEETQTPGLPELLPSSTWHDLYMDRISTDILTKITNALCRVLMHLIDLLQDVCIV